MNTNDVLIDLLEDNRRRLLRVFEAISDDCLYWRPESWANSIAITVWHMARIFDVFLTRQARGLDPQEECWFRHGWVELTGYDPRGLGLNGWGMLTGYSHQEVAGIPRLTREQLLTYLNAVYDAVRAYLADTPPETLLTTAPGFEGKYTRYQCIQMPLLDNVRHLGEVFAIKAAWEHRDS